MQSDRGLVKYEDRIGLGSPHLTGQLQPLGLAAGQLCGGLAQLDIGKAYVIQGLDLPGDGGHMLEKAQRLFYGHIQHIIDALPLILYLKGLSIIPFSTADLTGHIHIRKEMHLDLDDPVAAAGLAPAALNIKAEPALGVASGLGVGGGGEQVSDQVEDAGVGGRVGPRRPSDRGLVDGDDLIQLLRSLQALELTRDGPGPVQLFRQGLV